MKDGTAGTVQSHTKSCKAEDMNPAQPAAGAQRGGVMLLSD